MSQSITAQIRENTADILKQEGRPLAIREIKERLAGRGITDYRSGHLAGGLKQLLDMPGYISPERGHYQYTGAPEEDRDGGTVSGRMRQMYERVVRESSDLLNQVDIIDISEEEMQQIMTMRDVIRETKSLIGKIEQCCI